MAFVRELVTRQPELETLYQAHLADNYGEALPHMLMGDVTRWFIDRCVSASEGLGSPGTPASLLGFTRFLDETYQAAAPSVRELLFVSFLENLHLAGREYELVKSYLGPVLRSELDQLEQSGR